MIMGTTVSENPNGLMVKVTSCQEGGPGSSPDEGKLFCIHFDYCRIYYVIHDYLELYNFLNSLQVFHHRGSLRHHKAVPFQCNFVERQHFYRTKTTVLR